MNKGSDTGAVNEGSNKGANQGLVFNKGAMNQGSDVAAMLEVGDRVKLVAAEGTYEVMSKMPEGITVKKVGADERAFLLPAATAIIEIV